MDQQDEQIPSCFKSSKQAQTKVFGELKKTWPIWFYHVGQLVFEVVL